MKEIYKAKLQTVVDEILDYDGTKDSQIGENIRDRIAGIEDIEDKRFYRLVGRRRMGDWASFGVFETFGSPDEAGEFFEEISNSRVLGNAARKYYINAVGKYSDFG